MLRTLLALLVVMPRPLVGRLMIAPNPTASGWQELFATSEGRSDLENFVTSTGISGFKFMINCITNRFHYCAEPQWNLVVKTLKGLNVSIGIEATMFNGVFPGAPLPNSCNGTQDAMDDLAKVKNLTDAGGHISFWSMDSIFQHTYPYSFASQVFRHQDPADSCNFTVDEGIAEAVKYVSVIVEALPGVEMGMNEPIPWYWVTDDFPPSNVSQLPDYAMRDRDLASIVPQFQAALRAKGLSLGHFNADMPFEYSSGEITRDKNSNGWLKLARLQKIIRKEGMRFGKYFNSQDGGLTSDELFFARTISDLESFRAWSAQDPDDIILESWFSYPSKLLPLSDENSFLGGARKAFQTMRTTETPTDSLRSIQWTKNQVKVAAVQANAVGVNVTQQQALDMVASYVARAAGDGVDLIVFPEYFVGSLHAGDDTFNTVSSIAWQHQINVAVGSWLVDPDVPISSGCPGKECAKMYCNSVLVFHRNGTLAGIYNKTHAAVGGPNVGTPSFWPPGFQDLEWWMKWGTSYPIIDLDVGRIGVQTCYDGYFSTPSDAASVQGAEIFLWPNGRMGSIEPFLVQSILFQNQMYVIATNEAMGFGTMIATDLGGWAPPSSMCSNAGECYITSTLDMRQLRTARRQSRELHQRRPDLAAALEVNWDTPGFYRGYTLSNARNPVLI